MRRKLFTFFLALVAGVGTMFAEKVQIGDLYYNLDATNQTAEVTSQNSSYPYWSTTITTAIIPASVEYNSVTYSVTSIGGSAFSGCSSLTSVTIPNSVTSIGEYAFSSCSSLTSVTIPNSVTSIGNYAFRACSSLTSVTIGNSVTSIGKEAFYGCSSLTSVTIPNSVTSIGDGAFRGCSSLTKVNITDIAAWCNIAFTNSYSNPLYYAKHLFVNDVEVTDLVIPNSVTSIGRYAFSDCSSLTSVTIPNSVTSIGGDAFSYCTGLTSVTIGNSVTSIGNYAFFNCSSLISVTIPNSVTSIGEKAFYKCSGLTSVTIGNSVTIIGGDAFYNCSGLTSVTIPNSVKSIGSSAFSGCSSLTSVTIGNSDTSIGYQAFYGCSSLTSVTLNSNTIVGKDYEYNSNIKSIFGEQVTEYILGDEITSIGDYAFYECTGLTSIEIPNSVTSIGASAFRDCSRLTSVTIPNSVTSIGASAFSDCSGLTSVTIGNSVTSIGNSAFYGCSGLTSIEIPNSVTSIGVSAFRDCSGLTSVTIPNSVTSIGSYAFSGCRSLTSVTIPNGVTSIGDYAFYNCSSLPSVTIPNSVTSIGYQAFYYCSSLTSVTIPNSVTSIGYEAFRDCRSLTKVNITDIAAWCNIAFTNSYSNPLYYAKHLFVNDVEVTDLVIPNSVTSIGRYAFSDCSSLTSVTIPNSVTSIGSSAFSGCSSLTSVTIPNSVTSIGYGAFANCTGLTSVTIPNSVTSIGEYAFYNCSSLTSVTIPNSVKSIGSSAFSGCSSLTSVTIGNSVTSIGNSAFYGCSGLTSIEIPNSVTSIGEYAFYNCSSLTSVTIPNSVTSIGSYAFSGCSGLTSIEIPNSVTSIGASAFRDCSGLTSVTIPNSVTSIGSYAFSGCSSLTSVTIPNSVTSIGYQAFYECTGLTSVTIPNSVTSIGNYAFYGCSGLTAIYVPCGEMERFKQMLNNDSRIIDHAPLPYTIIINAINGTVAYPQTTCDDMQLTATPYNGYHFVKWSDGNTDNPRTIELTCDTIFTALFEHNQCTLSLQCDDNQGSVEGAGVFDYLAEVQISATPAYGYHFSSWSDGNTANPRTITLTKDVTLTVNFAPNTYTLNVSCNAEQGSVKGSGSYTYLSNRTIEATSNYGYHFTKWSDGNTDNPRIIELRQDTTLEAIFAVDKYGTCGDNLQLTWRYDTGSQTLTISGEGDLTTNMRYGVEAVKEMRELVIEDGVGVIGNEAFANIKTLNTITLGKDVRKLQERVFYNCYNLTAIYNYRKTPASATSNTFEEVDKYACTIYVMAGSEDMFRSATGWKDFYSILAIGATETTVTDNKATVEPSDNSATVTWPVSNDAVSYTIDITKDGVVFCRLTFNANGQLTGIAFAPGRDGQSMAPAAVMTANGLQFTVTGLNSNTQYGYSVTAKDANEQPIATYSGSFTTTSEGVATGIGNTAVEQKITKILHNGEVLILRDGKTYTIQGVEVK